MKIGCHLSSAKGYLAMGQTALSIGANVFQFFTRNPRGGAVKKVKEEDAAALRALMTEYSFGPALAHAPYTLNACAANEKTREFARLVFREDFENLEKALPGALYNFHPGSHVGQGMETGVELIAGLLNEAIAPDLSLTVLLETMAGKGSEIGKTFEELRRIIDRVEERDKIGVCLDTCHVFDGGYDLVHDLDGVLREFDRVLSLDRLRAVHLNDSLYGFGSHKDRHARIGEGKIGLDAFERIINHPSLRGLPFYLETPNDLPGYQQEIELLRSLYR